MSSVGEFVLPGDVIKSLNQQKGVVIHGPGLCPHEDPNLLRITQSGTLSFRPPNIYWVEGRRSRYIPKKGDSVVGVVAKKAGDTFRVDIGGSELAALSSFAFEGATKKQKPDLQVGDAVYARVLSAHKEMEPELVCIDSYFKAGKLGPLSNSGFLINISLPFACRLLDVNNPLLETLGKKFPYEMAIGVNGKIWINAKTHQDIWKVKEVLLAAERLSDNDIIKQCNKKR